MVGTYLVTYLYCSMRRVYGQRHLMTALKFTALSFAYLVSGSLMMAAVFLYSYLSL